MRTGPVDITASDPASSHSTNGPFVAIIGGGPAGLGVAHRLQERGHPAFRVFEAGPEVFPSYYRPYERERALKRYGHLLESPPVSTRGA